MPELTSLLMMVAQACAADPVGFGRCYHDPGVRPSPSEPSFCGAAMDKIGDSDDLESKRLEDLLTCLVASEPGGAVFKPH